MKACQQVYKLMKIIIRQYYYTRLLIYFVKESTLFGIKVKCLIILEITYIILVIFQQQCPFCITLFCKYSTLLRYTSTVNPSMELDCFNLPLLHDKNCNTI